MLTYLMQDFQQVYTCLSIPVDYLFASYVRELESEDVIGEQINEGLNVPNHVLRLVLMALRIYLEIVITELLVLFLEEIDVEFILEKLFVVGDRLSVDSLIYFIAIIKDDVYYHLLIHLLVHFFQLG